MKKIISKCNVVAIFTSDVMAKFNDGGEASFQVSTVCTVSTVSTVCQCNKIVALYDRVCT